MSRILIIDDDSSLRRLLRSILERAGHTVLEAPDGGTGLALWRREPTDVVVTDIFMPEKDGIEVIRELQTVAAKPKILAMSGGGRRGLLEWEPAALMLGADLVLAKPFDPRMFLLTVQELLEGQADTKEAVVQSKQADQRRYQRLHVSLPVSYGEGGIAHTGMVVDLSREGCKIRGGGGAPLGKYIRIAIRLDDPRETLIVDLAVMRWSRNGEFGCEFIRMEPDQQALLRQKIQSYEKALPRQHHQAVPVGGEAGGRQS